jgi:ribonuclease P protein component
VSRPRRRTAADASDPTTGQSTSPASAPETASTATRSRKFPAAARLRQAARFTAALRQGGFAADDTLVIHLLPNALAISRFGITIPRRTGNAVARNRWKRLIREAIRHRRGELPGGYDVVIRPKRGAVPQQRAITRGLAKTIRRAIRRRENKGPPRGTAPLP